MWSIIISVIHHVPQKNFFSITDNGRIYYLNVSISVIDYNVKYKISLSKRRVINIYYTRVLNIYRYTLRLFFYFHYPHLNILKHQLSKNVIQTSFKTRARKYLIAQLPLGECISHFEKNVRLGQLLTFCWKDGTILITILTCFW